MRGGDFLARILALALAASPCSPSVLAAGGAQSAAVSPPQIDHQPLRCLRAKEFPLVSASMTSPAEVKRARVYFKAHQHLDWYYVDMRVAEASSYLALLPQPLPETKRIDYYVQALDSHVQSAQTETYDPEVSRNRCLLRKARTALWRWPQKVVLGGTKAGQPAVPPGFSAKGIAAFVAEGSAAGASSEVSPGSGTGGVSPTAGVAAGAGAAGISATALLIGGGAAVAAGGVVAATASRSSKPQPTPTPNSTPALSIKLDPADTLAAVTEVTGAASATDPDGDTVVCQWDFGDGAQGTGTTVKHVYQRTGTFTVVVTATDSHGASATATGSVRAHDLNGLWFNSVLDSDAPTGTYYRCSQSGAHLGCQVQGVSVRPTVDGTLSPPMNVALTYQAIFGFVDVTCSGPIVPTFDEMRCFDQNRYYGMTRVSD